MKSSPLAGEDTEAARALRALAEVGEGPMTDSVGVFITGARETELKFDEFPQQAHQRLRARIDSLSTKLAARVRALVPRRSGKLAGEVSELVSDKPERIVGLVFFRGDKSAEYAKIGALEYGAHRATQVSAHSMRLGHLWGKAVATREVLVEAYTRRPNIEAHRFVRGPAEAMRGEIEAELKAAVEETIQQ